ncbi:hypothetical protein A3Q56_07352 [Intoshia linei]|uniref:cGMP-dependent protein kinase interacting domain-containing protein n=1 Tax=Intoshia linei TaxID=1819745 RepID=A0A177AU16_9BILA|nr:hypothetical protein A3Q56_07352 [Intoshia linei]
MDWYNVIKESSQNLRKETEEISKETSLNNVLPLDITVKTVENKIEQTLPKTTEKTFTIDNEENVQLIPRKHHGRKKVNDRRATGIEPNEEISEIIPNIKTNTNLSSLDDDQQTRVNYIIEKKKNNEAQKEIQRLQKTINECNAQLETTKKDNIRLKEENSSLIRVISRLSLRY